MHVGQEILQAMGLRLFTPQVVAFPGCGRTSGDYFQKLAEQMLVWKGQYEGVESMSSEFTHLPEYKSDSGPGVYMAIAGGQDCTADYWYCACRTIAEVLLN